MSTNSVNDCLATGWSLAGEGFGAYRMNLVFSEYFRTFYVAPQADPARIQWEYLGATSVTLDRAGSLNITLSAENSAATPLPL